MKLIINKNEIEKIIIEHVWREFSTQMDIGHIDRISVTFIYDPLESSHRDLDGAEIDAGND